MLLGQATKASRRMDVLVGILDVRKSGAVPIAGPEVVDYPAAGARLVDAKVWGASQAHNGCYKPCALVLSCSDEGLVHAPGWAQ